MNSIAQRMSTRVKRLLAVSSAVVVLATAGWAQANIYLQFGDGRVVRSSRSYSRNYVNQGAWVINGLPNGYISDPYSYNNGNPVYYRQNYWQSNNRRWTNDRKHKWDNNYKGHGKNGNNGHGNNR